jgi:hypothetical protein
MPRSAEEYLAQLASPEAVALRQETCDVLARGLATTGAVLWAFGLAEQPRRSIAAVIQMGGETARGAVALLRDDNRYGAAALVRQLVEIEYLLCLFAIDRDEPLKWASMDLEAVRREYQPARMRERCGDRFRSSEYSIHCQVGGHPRYAAAYVLPEHLRPGPFTEAVILATGWVDLGQHLVRIWRWVEEILVEYDLSEVGLAKSSLEKAKTAVALWVSADACAARLTEAEASFLAQASAACDVVH